MLNARQKQQENIAEYILYMWQLEDILRAFRFDMEAIEYNLVRTNYPEDEALRKEALDWYARLVLTMKSEKIVQKGHLSELTEIMAELYYLHSTLLNVSKDPAYIRLYEAALENIREFRERSNSASMNDVEICLNGLYSKLLLRLKKSEISEATEAAFETFRQLVALLSARYHQMKRGELNFHYN